MIAFSHSLHKIINYSQINRKRNSLKYNYTSRIIYRNSQTKVSLPLINHYINGNVEWNFKLIESEKCKIDCLLVLNNNNLNKKWIKKILPQTENILLADGGANILYSKIL